MTEVVYPYYGSGSIPYVDRAAYLAAESTRDLLVKRKARIIIHQDVPATIDPATGAILDAGVQSVLKDSEGRIDLDDAIAKAEEYSLESFVTVYGEEAAHEMDQYITSYGLEELEGEMSDDEWLMAAYPDMKKDTGYTDMSSLLDSMRESVDKARKATDFAQARVVSDLEESKAMDVSTVKAALLPGTKVLEWLSKLGDKVVGESNGKWLVSAAAVVTAAGTALVLSKPGSKKSNRI